MDFFERLFALLSIFSALSSIITAYLGACAIYIYLRNARRDRARYSIELIDKLRLNQASSFSYRKASSDILEKMKAGEIIDEMPQIFHHLGDLEALGIAVRKGLVEEDILRDYMASNVIEAFQNSREVIEALRMVNDRPEIYSDLEALSLRWSSWDSKNAAR